MGCHCAGCAFPLTLHHSSRKEPLLPLTLLFHVNVATLPRVHSQAQGFTTYAAQAMGLNEKRSQQGSMTTSHAKHFSSRTLPSVAHRMATPLKQSFLSACDCHEDALCRRATHPQRTLSFVCLRAQSLKIGGSEATSRTKELPLQPLQ